MESAKSGLMISVTQGAQTKFSQNDAGSSVNLSQVEKVEVSVVIPCLNEARSLGFCVIRPDFALSIPQAPRGAAEKSSHFLSSLRKNRLHIVLLIKVYTPRPPPAEVLTNVSKSSIP